MGIPNDEVVQIRQADAVGDPTMVTVSCPDKIGLGCDLCRIVLLLGLNILKADRSTDVREVVLHCAVGGGNAAESVDHAWPGTSSRRGWLSSALCPRCLALTSPTLLPPAS